MVTNVIWGEIKDVLLSINLIGCNRKAKILPIQTIH